MKLIEKDAVLAIIEKRKQRIYPKRTDYTDGQKSELVNLSLEINALEAKEVEECKQPEYSCFKTVYLCGKKPHWKIGDILAYYELDSDIEGECVLGKVINVELDEEQCDWLYTFENESVYDEQSLLEEKTYKKN